MFEMSVDIHKLLALFMILSQLAYFAIKKESNFILFSEKFRTMLLVQNVILGMVGFTGLLAMALTGFAHWSVSVVLMIFLYVGVVVHQILLYRRIRPIKSKEFDLQNEFKSYASKIYLSEAAAGAGLYILSGLMGR